MSSLPIASSAHAVRGLPLAAALVAVYLIWGTTYLAIRFALEGFAPFFQIGTRFIVAGLLMGGWLALRRAALPTARQWLHCAVVGTLMLGGGTGLVAVAEQTISSGAVTVLIGAMPVCAALWARAFGERTAAGDWIAIGLGTAGVLLLTAGGEFRASPAGTFSVLGAVLLWSLGSALSRRLDIPAGAAGFAAEMLGGGVVVLAFSAMIGEPWSLQAAPRAWAAWGYLVVFGSIVAFSAYMWLVAHVSAALATSYAYVNPLVALAVGAWLGGERIAWQTFAALPFVLGAVLLLARNARR